MAERKYHLSEEVLNEEACDLAFRKIMAVYCEIESRKILEEMEADNEEETVDVIKIDRLISSHEKKENARYLFSVSKKVFAWVASLILICGISVTSVIAASAEAREYVFDFVVTEMERYTNIRIIKTDSSEDELLSNAEYIPTFVPAGYELNIAESFVDENGTTLVYSNNDKYILFEQCLAESYDYINIDTENGYQSQSIDINGYSATLYSKDYSMNGIKYLIWQINDSVFVIYSNAELDILIEFAEGISENTEK